MSDLRKIVLRHSPSPASPALCEAPLQAILKLEASPPLEEVFLFVERAISEIEREPSLSWEYASRVAALSLLDPVAASSSTRTLLLLLRAYSSRDTEEVLSLLRKDYAAIAREIEKRKREAMIGNLHLALDYLGDFFGPGFTRELAEVMGVSRTTARRWMLGGGTRNGGRIMIWARAFYDIREKPGEGEKDALRWWRAPLETGISPREYFLEGWQYSPPGPLRAALDGLRR